MALRPSHPPAFSLSAVSGLLGDAATDVVVSGVALDSRAVEPGDAYVAAAGASAHGAAFAEAAIAAGAVAVVTDAAGARLVGHVAVPVVVVESPRAVVGALAAEVYGRPAEAMRMLGVTGTQGKTTTTRLVEGALQAMGRHAAVVGTIGTRIDGEDVKTALTTPEAPDLQALFAVMRERDVEACVMEVSSHALVMGRVDGIVFDVAAFTNLGRDHLDFHADAEDYFRAKATLFTPERARRAVVNTDDAFGRRLAAETTLPLTTYSADESANAAKSAADWQAVEVELSDAGSMFTVLYRGEEIVRAAISLPGTFNVSNAMCAIAMMAAAGYDAADAAAAIGTVAGVPGRLERVDMEQPFLAVVDYAHKPDAVEAVLQALRPQTTGRLIVVLGAGGDRDRGKRPLMGEIASRLADVLVVTDDNPRSEDPARIRAEILAGATGDAEVAEIGDRRAAIAHAVGIAGHGDTVVVAGKGHESGQDVSGVVRPFDDRDVLREELARL